VALFRPHVVGAYSPGCRFVKPLRCDRGLEGEVFAAQTFALLFLSIRDGFGCRAFCRFGLGFGSLFLFLLAGEAFDRLEQGEGSVLDPHLKDGEELGFGDVEAPAEILGDVDVESIGGVFRAAVFLGPLGLDDSDVGPNHELIGDVLLAGEVMEQGVVIVGDVHAEAGETVEAEDRLVGLAADVIVFVGDGGFGDFEVDQGHGLDLFLCDVVDEIELHVFLSELGFPNALEAHLFGPVFGIRALRGN